MIETTTPRRSSRTIRPSRRTRTASTLVVADVAAILAELDQLTHEARVALVGDLLDAG